MDNYKDDNSAEIIGVVLFIFSLMVVFGVAWAVN
jgi:hypothetical protein